jgi:hypothetical protein
MWSKEKKRTRNMKKEIENEKKSEIMRYEEEDKMGKKR